MAGASDFIAAIFEAPSAQLRLAPDLEPATAGQAWWWHTCLLSARAELEVDLGIRAQLPVLPPIVLAALQAVRDAAGEQHMVGTLGCRVEVHSGLLVFLHRSCWGCKVSYTYFSAGWWYNESLDKWGAAILDAGMRWGLA